MRQLNREDATKNGGKHLHHCVAPWRAEADYHRPARKPAGHGRARPAPSFPRGRHEENHCFRFPVRRRLHGAWRRRRPPRPPAGIPIPQRPLQDGSLSPPSTLRITVTGEGGAAPAAISDTPASKSEYERCRRVSDRRGVERADAGRRGAMPARAGAAPPAAVAGGQDGGPRPVRRRAWLSGGNGITFTLIDFRPAQGPEL